MTTSGKAFMEEKKDDSIESDLSDDESYHTPSKLLLRQVSSHFVDSLFDSGTDSGHDRPPVLPRSTSNEDINRECVDDSGNVKSPPVSFRREEDSEDGAMKPPPKAKREPSRAESIPTDEEDRKLPPKFIESPKKNKDAKDDDSISSLESEAVAPSVGLGLIAVGVPFPPENPDPEEAKQRQVSRAVAQSIAKEDYELKKKLAVSRAAHAKPASEAETTSDLGPSKRDLSRSRHKSMNSSSHSGMHARRAQRVAQRSGSSFEELDRRLMKKQQSMDSENSSYHSGRPSTPRRASRTYSSGSESISLSSIDDRSIEELIRRKQDDNDKKNSPAPTTRPQNVAARPSPQSVEELIRNKEAMHGAAIATSSLDREEEGEVEEPKQTPFAFRNAPPLAESSASSSGNRQQQQVSNRPSRHGSRVSSSRRAVEIASPKPLESGSRHAGPQTAHGHSLRQEVAQLESSDSEEEIEAQAGLPVARPGAFHVEGMNARNSSRENMTDSSRSLDETGHDPQSVESFAIDAAVEEQPVADAPLEAELHDEVIVEGSILKDDFTEEMDPKVLRRIKVMQFFILLFSMSATVLFILSVTKYDGISGGVDDLALRGWSQVGQFLQIETEKPQTLFGQSVAVSGNGDRLAVSIPGTDEEDALNVGEVLLFNEVKDEEGSSTWTEIASFRGPGSSSRAKYSLALSESGATVAVGYPFHEKGLVTIHREAGGEFRQTADLAPSESGESTWFGFSVDMSNDGRVLAVGAPLFSQGQVTNAGKVVIYNVGERVRQLGGDIVGEDSSEFFGWSVALQPEDGYRVAIGGPVKDLDVGVVRVYDFNGAEWVQIGESLRGEQELSRFGEAIAMSGDGKVLAVGARGTAFEPGRVYVYRDVNGKWIQDPNVFVGENVGEALGAAVKLSVDGNMLFIGGPNNRKAGERSGRIQVWTYDEGDGIWEQVGSDIVGMEGETFGSSLGVSSDGTRFVGGTPSASFDGVVAEAGGARIFERGPE